MTGTDDWTNPGAWQEAPNVHRIPLPMGTDGLRAINVYALSRGDGTLTLIDGGWHIPEAADALAAALSTIGHTVDDVAEVLVTHIHRDHYTLAMDIRHRSGARVVLGARERPSLDGVMIGWGRGVDRHFDLLRRACADDLVDSLTLWLRDAPVLGSADDHYELPDVWVAGGEKFQVGDRTLTVIATPGHTVGHVVYADLANRLAFTGDHLLPHITPSIAFEPVTGRRPLADFLSSLDAFDTLPPMRMLPAHGPTGGSAQERAHALLAHHEDRLTEIARLAGERPRTGLDVARSLGWTRRRRDLEDLDLFNQMLAVLETMHHLDLLEERGGVMRDAGVYSAV